MYYEYTLLWLYYPHLCPFLRWNLKWGQAPSRFKVKRCQAPSHINA